MTPELTRMLLALEYALLAGRARRERAPGWIEDWTDLRDEIEATARWRPEVLREMQRVYRLSRGEN